MSELPTRLRDAVTSHNTRSQAKASARDLVLWTDDAGRCAWQISSDEVWRLPNGPSDGPPLAAHETPAGFSPRHRSTIRAASSRPAGTQHAEPIAEILRRHANGTLLLDPASRAAFDGELPEGEALCAMAHVVPLRTPTLPPATHTNLVLTGPGCGLIVDPGSPWREEQDRFVAAYRRHAQRHGPSEAIFLTHHHGDHVGGAQALAARLGLPIWAHPLTAERVSFPVDRPIGDQEPLGPWTTIFTPGHAPGHLCLWHAESRTLIAGDMVASLGSIVIDPDEGDMSAYLQSLQRLRGLDARVMIPAHGSPITTPGARLDAYRAHRLWREDRIMAAVERGPAPLEEVTLRAYREVSPAIHWLAQRSALSHLRRLEGLGRVARRGDHWAAA